MTQIQNSDLKTLKQTSRENLQQQKPKNPRLPNGKRSRSSSEAVLKKSSLVLINDLIKIWLGW